MASITEKKAVKWIPAFRAVLEIVGVMVMIQGIRAILNRLGWGILRPESNSSPRWDLLIVVTLLLAWGVFWLVFRPKTNDLGLGWREMRRPAKVTIFIGGGLLLGLLISSCFLDPSLIAANVHGVLIVPVIEELIFRGWSWSRLERTLPGRWGGFICYVVITGLFALWHLGYGDVIYLRSLQNFIGTLPFRYILLMKVLVGGAVGLLAGFARWRTGKVYWSILLHGMWNMFGK